MKLIHLRRAVLGGALAAALALSAACTGGDAKKSANGLEKTDLNVAVMPIMEGAAIQIGITKGYFKAEGLNVKLQVVTGGAEALPKLKGGSLDISQGGHVVWLRAADSGVLKPKIVAEASSMTKNLTAILVAKNSAIRSPKDLAGKKIGTNAKGDQISLLVRAALEPYGVQIDEDKDLVLAPFPNQEQLLKTGKVDAVVVPEPFVTQLQQSIGALLLTDFSTGPTKDFPITGYGATEEFVQKNPKTVAAFQRAIVKAQADAADRAVLQEVVPKYTKIPAQVVSVVNLNGFPTSTSATRIQRVVDVMKQFGYLKTEIDVNSMVMQNG
ncbi:ABC transporter substrate-binding protein [Actinomadura sp. HBU206391]|uniref:ABC transporter substrate-binding protein n=1 Tax=Actinomadura sp. HBU206391 TaxID=2731692 RepID=UPI00164F19B0|nr:ABC transporter substrate-binding protein [Actinomadura sp. HBU206391]MBC6462579.1 ABC transporter substrate-binding protein [Actinomadura sp. HBU206391]